VKTTITLLAAIALLAGCSTTTIENATITEATFNSATWKSQAGVTGDATIEATTAPKTDTSLTGL
jgi:uncharacterized lipoprotein YajG